MNWNEISRRLAAVNEIIESWHAGTSTPEIEKDRVLAELREVYAAIKFPAAADNAPGAEVPAMAEEPEPAVDQVSEIQPAPEPEPEPMIECQAVPEPEEQPKPEPEPEPEPVELPKPKTTREALRSLYDDCGDEISAPKTAAGEHGGEIKPEPVPVKSYHNEHVKVLGETIGNGGQTIADAYASQHRVPDVASALGAAPVDSLRASIGVNDKFLMVRDLFASDVAAYELAMDTFETFGDLDDAMVYIYENYSWNPDDEAVRLLVDLLTRKLS